MNAEARKIIDTGLPEATSELRERPRHVFPPPRQPTPEPPDVGPMAAKYRELMEAMAARKHKQVIATADRARQNGDAENNARIEAALYALIGDPE